MSDLLETLPTHTEELQSMLRLQRAILDTIPLGMTVYEIVSPSEWRIAFINRAALGPSSDDAASPVGLRMEEVLTPEVTAQVRGHFQACIANGDPQAIEDKYELPGMVMWTKSIFAPIRDDDGQITHLLSLWEDVTASKQRELEERQQQEIIIQQQQATLAELSTPLLAISDTTVVMPLVGAVDSRRAAQIMEALLSGVAETRASLVILDITGVAVVDTQVANALVRASQAVKLLGAQVILTGIRPEVAQALVGLGVDLQSIITRGTLRDGIAYALKH
jgi:anti-anti-sigma regulatory factor